MWPLCTVYFCVYILDETRQIWLVKIATTPSSILKHLGNLPVTVNYISSLLYSQDYSAPRNCMDCR